MVYRRAFFQQAAVPMISHQQMKAEVPPELKCPLDSALFKDAVMIPAASSASVTHVRAIRVLQGMSVKYELWW